MQRWANRRNRWQSGSNNTSRELQITHKDGLCTFIRKKVKPIKTGEFSPNSNHEEDWVGNWREHPELGTRSSASQTGRQRAHHRQITHRWQIENEKSAGIQRSNWFSSDFSTYRPVNEGAPGPSLLGTGDID